MLASLLMVLLLLTALFLIVLVLIQRGKGGGLAGAFGGMGGQSAFGTKAGDLFTRITIGVASFWIILCIITVKVMGVSGGGLLSEEMGAAAESKPVISAPPSPEKSPAKSEPAPEKSSSPAPAKTVPAKGEAAKP